MDQEAEIKYKVCNKPIIVYYKTITTKGNESKLSDQNKLS